MPHLLGKNLVSLIIIFIAPIVLYGQQYPAPGLALWGTTEGLAQNTITFIHEDHEGFIWVGSHGGLQRFNGFTFSSFHQHNPELKTELNQVVRSIMRVDDQVYFAGEGTLFVLDLGSNKIKKLWEEENEGWAYMLHAKVDNRIYMSHTKDKGAILYFDLKTEKMLPVIENLFVAGYYDCAFNNGFFYVMNPEGVHKISLDSRASFLAYQCKKEMKAFIVNENNQLVIQDGDTIYIQDESGKGIKNFGKSYRRLFALRSGFSTSSSEGHLVLFNANGNEYFRIKSPLELQSSGAAEHFSYLINDQSGNIWFGQDGIGLFRLERNNPNFNRGPTEEFAKKFIRILFQDGPKTWVYAFDGSLSVIEHDHAKAVRVPNTVGLIRSLGNYNSEWLLVGSETEIWKMSRTNYRFELFFSFEKSIERNVFLPWDEEHVLLVHGRDNNLVMLEKAETKWIEKRIAQLPKTVRTLYALPDNRVLITYKNRGAEIWNPFSGERIIDLTLNNCTIADVLVDENGLWLCTNIGLVSTDFALEPSQHWASPEELKGIMLYSIEKDPRGYLWLGSNNGLYLLEPLSGQFKHFTQFHGLQCNEFNTRASIAREDGTLVFGGVKGLNIFNPLDFDFDKSSTRIIIEELKNHGRIIIQKDDVLQEFSLSENEVSIYLRVLATGGTLNERNEYAYALVSGEEVFWNEIGKNRDIIIQSVAPGNYKLLVKYRGDAGSWSEPFEILRLNVVPLIYNTWWFWLLIFSLIIAVGIYILRLRAIRQKEKVLAEFKKERAIADMRQQISRDLHDDLGSGITRLTLLARQLERKEESRELPIQKIAEMGTELSKTLKEVIWSTDPKLDNTESLTRSIVEYCSESFAMANIEVQFDVEQPILLLPVSPLYRQHIWMVVKECVQNIIKHSKANRAEIGLSLNSGIFHFLIKDNGIGFNEDQRSVRSRGMANMQQRANEIKANLRIESQQGKFTLVELKISLNEDRE